MTNTTNIYFRELGDAYVAVGDYQVKEKTKKGITPIQGAYQAGVNPVVRNLEETDVYRGVYVGAESHNWPLKSYDELDKNPDAFVDQAAYASGTYVSGKEYTSIPRFRAVKLFYLYKQDGSHDLVQFDVKSYVVNPAKDAQGNIIGDSDYVKLLVNRIFTEDEYLALCDTKGFVQYGNPLPRGFSYSNVSELSSINITLTDTEDGTLIPQLPVYVSPLWMNNSLPMFNAAYMEMDTLSILEPAQEGRRSRWEGIPDRILRWQGGGLGSDYIAPINRDGVAIPRDSYLNKVTTVTVDGVTYFGTDNPIGTMPQS